MSEAVQHLINSLPVGSEYALVALGLTLMFGVLGTPNIAHGGVYMFGAFTAYGVTNLLDLPFVLAVGAGAVVGAAVGLLVQFVAFERLTNSSELTVMVSALAALTILAQVALLAFGTESLRVEAPLAGSARLGGVVIPEFTLVLVGITLLITWGLVVLVRRSSFGRGMRAMAENRPAALLMGVSARGITYGTFAIGSAIGGLAGALLATEVPVNSEMGLDTVLKAFVVVVVGGIGSIPAAVVIGFALGALETLAAAYIGGEYRDIVAFVILVVFLVARPQGLARNGGGLGARAVQG
ncbi:MAG: inner-rane translocator [Blastococcus sp.]|nr:inner-rane translocator [Blastococcus sp.]